MMDWELIRKEIRESGDEDRYVGGWIPLAEFFHPTPQTDAWAEEIKAGR